MEEVVNIKFSLDGNKVLEPVNWEDLTEVFEYGVNSNQPSIEAESFTFQGESANVIMNHIHPNGALKPGNILVPMTVNVDYTQQGVTRRLLDDYILDPTISMQLNDTSFNNEFKPNEVVCSIRKKNGSDYFLTEIQGLTWGLLLDEGAVSNSDYVTIKTIVNPMYNFVDIATCILSIYSLTVQLYETIKAIKETIKELIEMFGAAGADGVTAPISIAFGVALKIAKAVLEIAGAIFLAALLVTNVAKIILMLAPPVLKNKGIMLRKGMEIICNRLGYNFVSNLSILDNVAYMPSGAHSEGKDLFKDALPNWFPNTRGVPNSYDSGYIAVEFIEDIKKLTNGRIDVVTNSAGTPTVYLRTEADTKFYQDGGYEHKIKPNYTNVEYNLADIPHTRLIEFAIDSSDLYTTEYQEGRLWEVKNVSNDGNLPFTQGEYITFDNLSLGYRNTKLSIIGELLYGLALIADDISSALGGKGKMAEKIKENGTGTLVVSQNNFSNPKLVVVDGGGKIPSNYKSTLSAQAVEESFYVNRSIVRGTGQKMKFFGVEVPMSLADRDKIKNNGNFNMEGWGDATFKKVTYQFSKDTAICDIEVDNNYIASGTFSEKTYDGL